MQILVDIVWQENSGSCLHTMTLSSTRCRWSPVKLASSYVILLVPGAVLFPLVKKLEEYIDKWFDFSSENVMVKLKPIGLYEELSFTDLEQVVAALKMAEAVSMDQL